MEDLKQIQEFFSKPLNENVYVEAFKLEKALKGMGHDVKVKFLDDFGKDVFEIYSKKPLDDDSIFYDAKKLGYPNARVFDHSNEGTSKYRKGYSNQKGFSPQLVSPENPRGKTDGLTTDTMNKILMKVIQDLDELKQLGEGMIEEKLCKKGQAYRKKRMAAGEKSSAYLNGRAVKVCKGQMKG